MLREGEDHPEGSKQLGWLEESHGISHLPLKSASGEDKGDDDILIAVDVAL